MFLQRVCIYQLLYQFKNFNMPSNDSNNCPYCTTVAAKDDQQFKNLYSGYFPGKRTFIADFANWETKGCLQPKVV